MLLVQLHLLYVLDIVVLHVDVLVGHVVDELLGGQLGLAAIDRPNAERLLQRIGPRRIQLVAAAAAAAAAASGRGAGAEHVRHLIAVGGGHLLDGGALQLAFARYLLGRVEPAAHNARVVDEAQQGDRARNAFVFVQKGALVLAPRALFAILVLIVLVVVVVVIVVVGVVVVGVGRTRSPLAATTGAGASLARHAPRDHADGDVLLQLVDECAQLAARPRRPVAHERHAHAQRQLAPRRVEDLRAPLHVLGLLEQRQLVDHEQRVHNVSHVDRPRRRRRRRRRRIHHRRLLEQHANAHAERVDGQVELALELAHERLVVARAEEERVGATHRIVVDAHEPLCGVVLMAAEAHGERLVALEDALHQADQRHVVADELLLLLRFLVVVVHFHFGCLRGSGGSIAFAFVEERDDARLAEIGLLLLVAATAAAAAVACIGLSGQRGRGLTGRHVVDGVGERLVKTLHVVGRGDGRIAAHVEH